MTRTTTTVIACEPYDTISPADCARHAEPPAPQEGWTRVGVERKAYRDSAGVVTAIMVVTVERKDVNGR